MSVLTFGHTFCTYSRDCNCGVSRSVKFDFVKFKNSTITLSWICTLSVAKGQEAHNLEEVVDPDIVEEKRSK